MELLRLLKWWAFFSIAYPDYERYKEMANKPPTYKGSDHERNGGKAMPRPANPGKYSGKGGKA